MRSPELFPEPGLGAASNCYLALISLMEYREKKISLSILMN